MKSDSNPPSKEGRNPSGEFRRC